MPGRLQIQLEPHLMHQLFNILIECDSGWMMRFPILASLFKDTLAGRFQLMEKRIVPKHAGLSYIAFYLKAIDVNNRADINVSNIFLLQRKAVAGTRIVYI